MTVNLTTLTISWTAPWVSIPINNYTVTMTNATSSQIINEWTTPDTDIFVAKTWESDCDTLDFVVMAGTDVGYSGFSQPNTTGFPYGKIWIALVKKILSTYC